MLGSSVISWPIPAVAMKASAPDSAAPVAAPLASLATNSRRLASSCLPNVDRIAAECAPECLHVGWWLGFEAQHAAAIGRRYAHTQAVQHRAAHAQHAAVGEHHALHAAVVPIAEQRHAGVGGVHMTRTGQPAIAAGTDNINAVDGSGAEPAGTYSPTTRIGTLKRSQSTPGAVLRRMGAALCAL